MPSSITFTHLAPSAFLGRIAKNKQPKALDLQKEAAPKAVMRTAPQVYAAKDGTISLLVSAPKIKNIALAGGGASALMMPHALVELGKPFFDDIKSIAGCSSGALVGTMLASGLSPAELDARIDQNLLPSLLGTVPSFGALYPMVTFQSEKLYASFSSLMACIGRMFVMKTFVGSWQKSAQSFIQTLDQWSSESVTLHLKKPDIWKKVEAAHANGQLNAKERNRLVFLKNSVWFDKPSTAKTSRTEYMITFNDLALLHRIEPAIFKELTIVSSKIDENQTEDAPSPLVFTKKTFNAKETPDVPIAIAGRASMSMPLYFQDCWYSGASYQDGGMISRIPAEIFVPLNNEKSRSENASAQAETIVVAFANRSYKKDMNRILYQKPVPGQYKTLTNKVVQWFLNYPTYPESVAQDNHKLYDMGPNVRTINNEGIDTFDMHPSKKQIDAAKKLASINMQKQVELHKNEAYCQSFNNVEAAWQALSEAQKNAVHQAGDPQLEPDFESLPERTQHAQLAFYKLSQPALLPSTLLARLSNCITALRIA